MACRLRHSTAHSLIRLLAGLEFELMTYRQNPRAQSRIPACVHSAPVPIPKPAIAAAAASTSA